MFCLRLPLPLPPVIDSHPSGVGQGWSAAALVLHSRLPAPRPHLHHERAGCHRQVQGPEPDSLRALQGWKGAECNGGCLLHLEGLRNNFISLEERVTQKEDACM